VTRRRSPSQVIPPTLDAVGPQHLGVAGVDELQQQAQGIIRRVELALQRVAHAQFAPDLTYVDRLAS
jgi:hypothetical protein